MFTELEHHYMQHALTLAERGRYSTDPNPRVGCVLVKNGVTERALVPIAFFYLAALFGICFLLIQQVKSLAGKSSEQRKNAEFSLAPILLPMRKRYRCDSCASF